MIENLYPSYQLADFSLGAIREHSFSITQEDVIQFARVSADSHPLHVDTAFAQQRGYVGVLSHGMLVASRCSAFIARDFVGANGLLVSLSSDFRHPVLCGDELIWQGKVMHIIETASVIEIGWNIKNTRGVIVQLGTACSWLSK